MPTTTTSSRPAIPANLATWFDPDFLARLERLQLIAKRVAQKTGVAPPHARTLGDGLEFADHRAYISGDDVRFVDWPYFARMEKLLLRLFHQHSEADLAILLDTSASMGDERNEKFRYTLRVAAALSYVAMAGGQRVILLPFADEPGTAFRTARNKAQFMAVLDYLAELRPAGKTNLQAGATHLRQAGPATGTALLLSDLFAEEATGESLDESFGAATLDHALSHMGQANRQLAVLQIHTPQEATPTLTGAAELRDTETAETAKLHITPALLESYRVQWETRQKTLAATCAARRTIHIPARTDIPFETLVLESLRQAGVITR